MNLTDPKEPWYEYEETTWISIGKAINKEPSTLVLRNIELNTMKYNFEKGSLFYSPLSNHLFYGRIQITEMDGFMKGPFGLVDDLKPLIDNEMNNKDSILIKTETLVKTSPIQISDEKNIISIGFQHDIKKERIKLSFEFNKNHHFYGLGEKYYGLDKKGRRYLLYNTDYSKHAFERKEPMYQSHNYLIIRDDTEERSKYVAIFVDRPEMTYVDLRGKSGTAEIEVYSPFVEFYIIQGEDIMEITKRYADLTGKMNLPPLWTLGTHQCRWGYKSSEDIRNITSEYRKRKIPCDGIWYDIDYMDSWAIFTWHPDRFSDYKELNKELHEDNWKIVTIIDPGMSLKANYKPVIDGIYNNYFAFKDEIKEGTLGIYESGVWPISSLFPDFFRTEVKNWWAKLNKDFVLDGSVDGIWNDMNELVCFKKPDRSTYPRMLHLTDEGERLSHFKVHNLYAFEENKATFAGLSEAFPDRRPFVLTRAGYPGTQRYSASWTGDIFSSFEEIWQSMPMMGNMGLSGQPFVGADIGGFASPSNPVLLIRFSQLGIFYPFARNHSAMSAQEPWVFDQILPKTSSIIKSYYRFRYMLLPYLYSLFEYASTSGVPIFRPTCSNFPFDKQLATEDTTIMLGPSLLIAPIYEESEYDEEADDNAEGDENIIPFKPDTRNIYLPKDERWFDPWTNMFIEGGKEISIIADLKKIPLFIKNNSVIPTRIPAENTKESAPKSLILNIFTDISASSTSNTESATDYSLNRLYIDSGEGFGYKQGNFAKYIFEVESGNGSLKVKMTTIHETLAFKPQKILLAIHGIHELPKSASNSVGGLEIINEPIEYPAFLPQSWDVIEKDTDLPLIDLNTVKFSESTKILVACLEFNGIDVLKFHWK